MHISVVLGTGRKGRQSEKVALALYREFQKNTESTVEYVDVRECLTSWNTTRYDPEHDGEYSWYTSAMKSDGFVFVIPEYNRSYPGEWKMLMDSLRKDAFKDKVAGIVGVSSGVFGGARAIESAMLTLVNRGMYVMKDALHFPFVETHFDEKGDLIGEEQKVRVVKFAEGFFETVSKYR